MGKWPWTREIRTPRSRHAPAQVVLARKYDGCLRPSGRRRLSSAVPPPESVERLPGLARPLVRPPVTAAVEEHELAAHASGQALGEAWGDVGVVAAPEDQGGPRDAGDIVLPLLADAYRRA